MAFRPPRQPPKFADLKGILAQTKDLEDPLYQVVQEIIERLSSFQFEVPTEIIKKGGGGTGNPVTDATYFTVDNETADLPNSRQLLIRYGLKADDTIPDRRVVDLDLEYFGGFVAGPLYSDGDVVIGSDNIAYLCVRPTNAPPVPWPGTGIPSPPPANDATYWTVSPSAGLSQERALNLLANGYVKSTAGEPSTIPLIPLSDGGTGNSLVLAPTGNVLISNGSNVVFNNGLAIAQLNASSLSTGTVNDARLSSNVPLKNANNNWTGQNDFQGYAVFSNSTGIFSPTIVAPSPILNFYESDQPTDKHYTRVTVQDGVFFFQGVNDAYNTATTYASFSSAGFVIGPTGAGTIFADGVGLTNLNASQLATGTVPLPRLGTNAPAPNTFLAGDNTWKTIPSVFPSGLIVLNDGPCPPGWTRVNYDGRFIRVNSVAGGIGGADTHRHNKGTLSVASHNHGGSTGPVNVSVSISGTTDANGAHDHSFGFHVGGTTGGGQGGVNTADAGGSFQTNVTGHNHTFGADVAGTTSGIGNHQHGFSGSGSGSGTGSIPAESVALTGQTDDQPNYPPYIDLILCRKD